MAVKKKNKHWGSYPEIEKLINDMERDARQEAAEKVRHANTQLTQGKTPGSDWLFYASRAVITADAYSHLLVMMRQARMGNVE